jgi:N-acylneuraminate cytidylyltransferase
LKIKRLAIIPARSGSKRIKNKNLKFFHGKPLIYYSIKALKDSKIFSKIHVSSNSDKILNYSNKLNIKTDFKRPNYLADDKTGLNKVLKYVVSKYKSLNQIYDEVWLIFANNPFITKKILIECCKEYKKINYNNNNALMTVTKYNYPINWAQKLSSKNYLLPLDKFNLKTRSQDLIEAYCEAGMINVYSNKSFYVKTKLKYYPFILPIHSSIDIDTIEDYEFAKILFKNQK